MPRCKYKHNYRQVTSPYKNGKLSPDSFEDAEWVVETRCSVCDIKRDNQ